MIAMDQALGVRASATYTYCVILSPVGPYYQEGFNPVSLYVADEFTRAAKGGLGEAKTGANYAASLLAGRIARKKGCAQVLWLDGAEHRYVEEVGAMNIFFVFNGNTLVTPQLNGSILPGVTRDCVIKLAPMLGLKAEERKISIDEVIGGIATGSITEIFGTGTAASISPVGSLQYKNNDYVVNSRNVGPVSQQLSSMVISKILSTGPFSCRIRKKKFFLYKCSIHCQSATPMRFSSSGWLCLQPKRSTRFIVRNFQ
jgi:branched-chain amino acid aminotransferase